MRSVALLALLGLSACGGSSATFTVYATSEDLPLAQSFFEFVPQSGVEFVASSNPEKSLGGGGKFRIAVQRDLSCAECYQLHAEGTGRYVVHAGDALGAQYGLAALLEAFGFRFFHPYDTVVPATLTAPDLSGMDGQTASPQVRLRGLHLHTLHPIEPYFAFWIPGSRHFDDARRILDWVVKNRGNYVQWAGLDNIQRDPTALAAWQAHQQGLIAYAHQRGLKVGFNYELFASANLQLAFDLLSSDTDPQPATTIASQLQPLEGLGFDTFNVSFGEFNSSDPTLFINAVNANRQVLDRFSPSPELAGTVHVGANVNVTYQGQTMPYYDLVQFCDRVTAWVHTVMYYDLFQSAGGAYGLADFSQQRGFLEAQSAAGKHPAYFPESAYWVAFDNSVPTYLPVYLRSRWLDLSSLGTELSQKGLPPLDGQIEFSSGWEWGYWQNDYLALRDAYQLPASWDAPVAGMFAPFGEKGTAVSTAISALGELESQALIDQGLAPYFAGRDFLIDQGATSGITSQPQRPSFASVAALSAADRQRFTDTVLTPLAAAASQLDGLQAQLDGAGVVPADRWLGEVYDGVAVDAQRAHFILDVYQAAASFGAQGNDGGWVARAQAALAAAQPIVARRHAHLHSPESAAILQRQPNDTLYHYGYLYEADTLCYWNRELVDVQNLVAGSSVTLPACVL